MSDPFSIAAGVIAVAQLSQSIGLFVYGLTERPELCRRLASELESIEGITSQLQSLEDTSQPEWQLKVPVLRQLVEGLKMSLEQLDVRLKKASVPKPETLMVWPVHERAITGTLDTIERWKTSILIQLYFEHAHLCRIINQQLRENQSDIQLVNSNVSELLFQTKSLASDQKAHYEEDSLRLAREEREATIAWLTNVSFVPKHNALKQKFVEGTTNWFFEEPEFHRWKTSSDSKVLAVFGNAGCGKSMIASRLVKHIEEMPGSGPVAYVYCSTKPPSKSDPRVLTSSLLQQLCRASPILDESVIQLREQYRRLSNAEPSFNEITKVLVSVIKSSNSTCFLVIDGLDECVDGSKLAAIIDMLRNSPAARVKVAIFSRPSCPIRPSYFGDVPQITINPESNRKDIELFAQTKIEGLVRDTEVLKSPSLRSEVVQTMLRKAEGVFLWIHLQAEDLRSQPTEKLLRDALQQLPPGFELVFESSLQRIREQRKTKCQLAVRTLNWALSARRPLQIGEMLEAIAVEDGMSCIGPGDLVPGTQLLTYCADLVILDPRTRHVHLLHSSLRATLQQRIRDAATGHNVGLPLSKYPNLDLARVCVTYLGSLYRLSRSN